MSLAEQKFGQKVEALVRLIPSGKVMTYGQLAALCGQPMAARVVGGIAHFGDPSLPWQRVVNRKGGLASGYPGGPMSHQEHLQSEGVVFDTMNDQAFLSVSNYLWQPDEDVLSKLGLI